jgi:hypothetical protein
MVRGSIRAVEVWEKIDGRGEGSLQPKRKMSLVSIFKMFKNSSLEMNGLETVLL